MRTGATWLCAAFHVNAVHAGPGHIPCSQVWYSLLRKTHGAEPDRQSGPGVAGQNVSHIDSLFTGGQMGLQSDIADGRYCHPFRRSGAAVTELPQEDVPSRRLCRSFFCAAIAHGHIPLACCVQPARLRVPLACAHRWRLLRRAAFLGCHCGALLWQAHSRTRGARAAVPLGQR